MLDYPTFSMPVKLWLLGSSHSTIDWGIFLVILQWYKISLPEGMIPDADKLTREGMESLKRAESTI